MYCHAKTVTLCSTDPYFIWLSVHTLYLSMYLHIITPFYSIIEWCNNVQIHAKGTFRNKNSIPPLLVKLPYILWGQCSVQHQCYGLELQQYEILDGIRWQWPFKEWKKFFSLFEQTSYYYKWNVRPFFVIFYFL